MHVFYFLFSRFSLCGPLLFLIPLSSFSLPRSSPFLFLSYTSQLRAVLHLISSSGYLSSFTHHVCLFVTPQHIWPTVSLSAQQNTTHNPWSRETLAYNKTYSSFFSLCPSPSLSLSLSCSLSHSLSLSLSLALSVIWHIQRTSCGIKLLFFLALSFFLCLL